MSMHGNKQKNIIEVKLSLIFFLSLLVLVLSSCGHADKPEIKINTKKPNVTAGDVTISLDISNFELAGGENRNNFGKGHIIYYKDVPVPTYYEHAAITQSGTYAESTNTTHTWKGITPGEHTFSAQLVDENNSPLPVPIYDSIKVNIPPPQGEPILQINTPKNESKLSPGHIVMEVKVDNFVISGEDMGALNREGEGHLIYYLDEDPPIAAGEPALTNTSVVSSDLSHLWQRVGQGEHVLSVQLVNNNDCPLDKPVVQSVTISVD